MNIILLLGALLGISSVIMAAFIDHSQALHLTAQSLRGVLTAVRYHQFYALVVSMIGLTLLWQINNRIKSWLARSGYVFSLGIILFSFSIYLSSLLEVPGIIYLTPVGGILLMTGWIFLARVALFRNK